MTTHDAAMKPTWRRPRAAVFPGLVLLAALASACASLPLPGRGAATGARGDRQPIEPALAAETFDTAWVRVRDTYYDPAMRGIDWDAVRAELYPRAASATTYGALRGVLHEMVARLGESHFGIVPREAVETLARVAAGDDAAPAASRDGDIGLEVRVLDGALVVTRVTPGGAAEAAGIRSGWLVEQVDALDLRRALADMHGLDEVARRDAMLRLAVGLANWFAGDVGEPVALTLIDPAGTRQRMSVERTTANGQTVQFGNLPPIRADLDYGVIEHDGLRIGIIRYNVWMPVLGAGFDRAMAALADTDGLVLDLRGNTGGVAGLVMRIAGHFVGEAVPLGVLQMRGNELRFVVNPQRVDSDGRPIRTYTRPLALLTDEISASTTEIFAAGLKHLGRATIFGERTAGQALPAMLFRLPSGDVLMHVIADLRAPDGTRIEGDGIEPHVTLPLQRADLLDGRDRVLEAALAWFGTAGSAGAGAGAKAAGDEDAFDGPLPDGAAVLDRFAAAVGRADALLEAGGIRSSGRFEVPASGMSGVLAMVQAPGGRSFVRVSMPGYGDLLQGYDGTVGWSITPGDGARLVTGAELAQMRDELDPRALVRDPSLFVEATTVGVDRFDGEPCHRVRLVWQSGRETYDCYSVATGLLIATVAPHVTPAGATTVTTLLGEYRDFDGVLVATRVRQQAAGGEQILHLDTFRLESLAPTVFEPPAAVRALQRRRQARSSREAVLFGPAGAAAAVTRGSGSAPAG
jgi:carboxyl-terminal processing protease